MNTPENVPPITDVRYATWDRLDPTHRQLTQLKRLLAEEGVDPAELYGGGFTSVDHLSRWGASWGIGYLVAAQEARWVNDARARIERENAEQHEQHVKWLMGRIVREYARGR